MSLLQLENHNDNKKAEPALPVQAADLKGLRCRQSVFPNFKKLRLL